MSYIVTAGDIKEQSSTTVALGVTFLLFTVPFLFFGLYTWWSIAIMATGAFLVKKGWKQLMSVTNAINRSI
jgi:hypothetical protein